METTNVRATSLLRRLDWFTIALYATLLILGWISVCCASYEYGQPDFFDLATRSGKQLIWICCSVGLAFVLLMLDDKLYDTFAYFAYITFMLLLLVTPFIATDVKGSYSWIKIGSLSLQPAEFAKCATALALAKFMGTYGFNLHHPRSFLKVLGLILLPMALIVLQRETGSALVYTAFFLMLYREGMPGGFLFTGVAMIIYFVIGIKFEQSMLFDTPTSVGKFSMLLLVQLFSSGMVYAYNGDRPHALRLLGLCLGVTVLAFLFSEFVIPFDIVWVQLILSALLIGYLIYNALRTRFITYLYAALFALGSIAFFYSADYVLNDVMQPHQRVRINVLLGLDDDLAGAGYNVHQSEIAIGSGGLQGKGFLNGTQTKLKFVPEQDTDFIFCTVGEEEGFLGSAAVLLLFLALITRLMKIAERQPFKFGRVYGYCVASVFLFHVFINVGMVLGLTPVIGIPLPFFSYGGSSLWGFTILLFIFLRIDAGRNLIRS